MKCTWPECKCDYETYDHPFCEKTQQQKFCNKNTGLYRLYNPSNIVYEGKNKFMKCDWEFSCMFGGLECNMCGAMDTR